MNLYLNTNTALENYKQLMRSKYFIDKSNIIEQINSNVETSDKYICITKPRRFGKSSIINMIGAYYTKEYDSKDIFNKLNISKSESYLNNLNKYNVINLSFSEIPENMKCYEDYISNIKNNLKEDLLNTFSSTLTKNEDLYKLLDKSGEKFIFIIDEWDYIFSQDLFLENQREFLEFLRNLLKDRAYVALVYMTGVLPIKKYSEGSALNMFKEYTMLNDHVYSKFFGFTENEVKDLCLKNKKMQFKDIKEWYNGYLDSDGEEIYNPRSVVCALNDNYCQSYWTNTGRKDTETMEKIINDIHNSEIPILQYNDENSLSCVVTLAYLAARNYYRIEREEKSGKGYADFMFHPRKKTSPAIILELKKDDTPNNALKQIKEKNYAMNFIKENKDRKILAVAICYNSKEKKHQCKIEEL